MTTINVEQRVRENVSTASQKQTSDDEARRASGHTAAGAAAGRLHLAEAAHGLALPVLRGRHVVLEVVMGDAESHGHVVGRDGDAGCLNRRVMDWMELVREWS